MRLPDSTQRLAIIGRTGTGKTVGAAYMLARSNFSTMPWIILDYKRDKLLNSLKAKELDVTSKIPSRPGLYIVHPMAQSDDEKVVDLLWRIWQKGNTGVYTDEGYMVGNHNPAFRALLTQGRSKHIPMITLSQRPVEMDRFAFSEADFYQVYSLNDRKDYQRVGEFLHRDIDLTAEIPRYHSWYHDVAENQYCLLKPVPRPGIIREMIRSRIGTKKVIL